MKDQNLYDAILSRRSVRQYKRERLDESLLTEVDSIIDDLDSLQTGLKIGVLRLNDFAKADLTVAQGAYGRFINPPHLLLPYLEEGENPYIETGYQSEQIAVHLNQLGIGTCYVGSAGREGILFEHFDLPSHAHAAAVLMYGLPSEDPKRSAATYFRSPVKLKPRLPLGDLFLDGVLPPADYLPILEAGRRAPSATNAQPWRFLWHEGTLYVFVHKSCYSSFIRRPVAEKYMWYDGGICLANITLALEAEGRPRHWELLKGVERFTPDHDSVYLPLAKMELS